MDHCRVSARSTFWSPVLQGADPPLLERTSLSEGPKRVEAGREDSGWDKDSA